MVRLLLLLLLLKPGLAAVQNSRCTGLDCMPVRGNVRSTSGAKLGAGPSLHQMPKVVFIGGVGPHYSNLADPMRVAGMLTAGNIGLYQHANGNAALTPAQRTALWTTWGIMRSTGARQGQSIGEIGAASVNEPIYLSYFGGVYPAEVNVNIVTGLGDKPGSYTAVTGDAHPGIVYTGFITPSDLGKIKSAINSAVGSGTKNAAVYMTPNGGGEDLDDTFATAPFWANVRAAAQYGGGIALDVPPTYWLARGPAYQAMVSQMVGWANANHLRSSFTVSPYAAVPDAYGNTGGCGYDQSFMTNTRALVLGLTSAGTLPSQWVVENYGLVGTHCGTANDIQTDTTADSLNSIALYLARIMKIQRGHRATSAPSRHAIAAAVVRRPLPPPLGSKP